jgi:uncharacterized integral membrane protein
MATIKAFIQTLFVIGAIALTAALVYFLTIFGGAIILGIVVFLIIREYNREVSELDKESEP